MSVLYHPGKDNVGVHKLARVGGWLEDSPNGCFVVNHTSNTSLVVEVKSKEHLDPLLLELKESVLGKVNESFSHRGMGFLGNKVGCVYGMLMI